VTRHWHDPDIGGTRRTLAGDLPWMPAEIPGVHYQPPRDERKTRLHHWVMSKLDDAGIVVPAYGFVCFVAGYLLAWWAS
jgi:hypothetical protein